MNEGEQITVVIIDDSEFYRWLFKNFLQGQGIVVTVDFTQKLFAESVVEPTPEIIIVSHRENRPEILQTIAYTKEKFPAAKIIASVSIYDKTEVEEIKKIGVQGLV